MNRDLFDLLPYERQLVAVFDTGAFLATRWEEETAFNLYELPGRFLVELQYDTAANALVGLTSFRGTELLEDYVAGVELPE